MDCGSRRGRFTIFQNHRIDDLSAENASPPPKMFVGSIEFFVNHMVSTAMAFHENLLLPLNPPPAAWKRQLAVQPVIDGDNCFLFGDS
jgi:uncharacterized damage-inducible protein DinB